VCWIADVGDQLGIAVDVHDLSIKKAKPQDCLGGFALVLQ
jgi:hypothetical protein